MKEFLDRLTPPASFDLLASWGRETVGALTDYVDNLIAPVLELIDSSRTGVYAVGGYGRRELSPWSDIDLLFVTYADVDLSACIAGLWDLGVRPSILIRGVELIERSVAEDLAFATTAIDARFLCGLRLDLLCGPKLWIKRARPKFAEEHAAEKEIRRNKFPGAGFQEPHLREGAGGLRDVQMRRWISELGLGPPLDDRTKHAYDTLLGARAAIHCALRRREERLLMSDHAAINEWLGWKDSALFSKKTLLTMKRIAADAAESQAPTVSEFRRAMASDDAHHLLREYDRSGALSKLLPDWSRIECLTRDDAIHLYTPEEHTLRALERFAQLRGNPLSSAPVDIAAIARVDLLNLAILFHDIGKGSGEDHSIRGRAITDGTMTAWGYSREEIETVKFLVEHHLLLSRNAFMRDIHDPALIHALAGVIGDIERLTMLYYLTVADIQSVSESAWTEWKASLLNTLTKRLEQQCRTTLPPAEMAEEILKRRKNRIAEILQTLRVRGLDEKTEEHFRLIDARYALVYSPEQIARHIELIPRLMDENAVIERVRQRGRFTEVVVITRTHHGLFAEIAGALSARGFNILEADISTRADGIAIDSFKVMDVEADEQWRRFDEDLKNLFAGTLSVTNLLAQRMPYARKPAGRGGVTVRFDNEASATHTVVEVTAPDEMGLLYRIASIFRDCDIGITSAIVSTSAGLGVDVFYVTTTDGRKLVDKGAMERMTGLLERIPEGLQVLISE